jgi:hypothetical protein
VRQFDTGATPVARLVTALTADTTWTSQGPRAAPNIGDTRDTRR